MQLVVGADQITESSVAENFVYILTDHYDSEVPALST